MMTRRRDELIGVLSRFDHGDGCLGIIVDHALDDDPDASVDDLAEILSDSEAEARGDIDAELGGRW